MIAQRFLLTGKELKISESDPLEIKVELYGQTRELWKHELSCDKIYVTRQTVNWKEISLQLCLNNHLY